MAYVRKRSTGWQGVANYSVYGTRKRKIKGGFKLKKQALAWATKTEEEMLKCTDLPQKEVSFADYYLNWYKTYKKNGISVVSQKRYMNFYREIKRYFGDKKLKDITRTDFQRFINSYGKNHAPSTVSKLIGFIRNCISNALYDGVIDKDFTFKAENTGNKAKIHKVQYLSNEEIKALLDATISGLSVHYTGRYMILTALLTGMRKSEIQALTWSDIDFMHATISISKSWNELTKEFKPTKTKSSKRVIKVDHQLLGYLKQLRVNGSSLVFTNQYGTIPTSTALNKLLRQLLKECGIQKQGFHFHSLRHVHVAYLIAHGVDIYAISKRLGHSKVSITLDTYSYLLDEYRRKNDTLIVDKLSELFC